MLELERCSSECMDSRMPSGLKPPLFPTKTHGLSLLTTLPRYRASTPFLYAGLECTYPALHSPCTSAGDRVSTVHTSSDFLISFGTWFFSDIKLSVLSLIPKPPPFYSSGCVNNNINTWVGEQ